MGLIEAFILFTVFIIIYVIIVEIFTVLFRLTGLTEKKARFQVISMLTNSGFTTQESEIIVSADKRRKLASATMIFGYSFSVIIVSSGVNMLLSLRAAEVKSIRTVAVIIICAITLLYIFIRNTKIKRRFDAFIEKIGAKVMFGEHANSIVLLDNYGHSVIAQVQLFVIPELLKGKTLKESGLKDKYNLLVMFLQRGEGEPETVSADTILQTDDTIIIFGGYKTIREIFDNPQ